MSKGEVIRRSDLPVTIREQSIKTKYASHMTDNLPSTVEVIEKDKNSGCTEQDRMGPGKGSKIARHNTQADRLQD